MGFEMDHRDLMDTHSLRRSLYHNRMRPIDYQPNHPVEGEVHLSRARVNLEDC